MTGEPITQNKALRTRGNRAFEFLNAFMSFFMFRQISLFPESRPTDLTNVVLDTQMHGIIMFLQIALEPKSELALLAFEFSFLLRMQTVCE